MSTPDQLLAAKIGGTAQRVVNEQLEDAEAIAEIRRRAEGRTDLLRQEAAGAIGAWVGRPHTPKGLRMGYLMLMAADVELLEGDEFVRQVEVVRRRVGGPGHGASDANDYRPPT